ncbi:MAG: Fe-S cluster assembly protein SufD [candidate division WOR-3 bacterium]
MNQTLKFLDEVREVAFKTYNETEPLKNKYVDYRVLKPEQYNPDIPLSENFSNYISNIIKEEKDTIGFALFVDNKLQYVNLTDEYKGKGIIIMDLFSAFNELDFNFQAYFSKVVSPTEDKFTANHYLNIKTGLFIYIPKNVIVEKPFQVLFVHNSNNIALYPHILIVLDKGANFSYIDELYSINEDISGFYNPVYEIYLHDNSLLNFSSIYDFNLNVYSYGRRRVILNRDSKAYINHIWIGGKYSVNHMELLMNGEGSEGEDIQIFFGRKEQFYSLYSRLMHRVGNSVGNVFVRGALKDKSRAHFDGLIKIFPKAQNSNAYLQENTILLNPGTRADAIPGLEISANNVRCTHSATVSEIDYEKLFYLMSRGLDENNAKKLIVLGHFNLAIERIQVEKIKDRFLDILNANFE